MQRRFTPHEHHDMTGTNGMIGVTCEFCSTYRQQAVRIPHPDVIIMRPSVVFGPEDQFFNRFATMARFMPALPLVGGGATELQPVFAGIPGTVIAVTVEGEARRGTTCELGGPEIATLFRSPSSARKASPSLSKFHANCHSVFFRKFLR